MNFDLLLLRLKKLNMVLRSPVAFKALRRHHVLAAVEHSPIISLGHALLVDIGANRGQFSLAFRSMNPTAMIHAFEPLPEAAETYRRVFEFDRNFTLHELAVGPNAELMSIHVSQRDDSSSLLPIGNLQSTHFPGTGESHTKVVTVKRLSDVLGNLSLPKPALLKIDVQGYELHVLQGSEELLPAFDRIYCECSFVPLYDGQALATEIIEFLSDRGFQLRGIHNPCYAKDGSTIQADFLFERRELLRSEFQQ